MNVEKDKAPERTAAALIAPPDRPFWSSDEGSSACDFIPEGAAVCCDAEPVAYEIEWQDGERSSSCKAHGPAADRNLVTFIRTQR